MARGWIVVVSMSVASCAEVGSLAAPETCIEAYSAQAGWGVDEDPIWWGRDPEAIELDCALFGDPCEADDFITRAAAQCIAETHGLVPGLRDWNYDLGYEEPLGTVRWRIEAVTEIEDTFSKGDFVAIDAETGDIVDKGAWVQEALD